MTTDHNLRALEAEYRRMASAPAALDITRGKPSSAQLDLSNRLDGILGGDYDCDGIDSRNYLPGHAGLPGARRLGAMLLDVPEDAVLAGGSSSLQLMYTACLLHHFWGLDGAPPWNALERALFLCPCPGYDRHFAICEQLGIEMLALPMTGEGPDMDALERALREHPQAAGLWCVPRHSNPTGCTYSPQVVERLAALPRLAAPHFRIFWDNAYSVHHLVDAPPPLTGIWERAEACGTLDALWMFASTSKITMAGAGLAFAAASERNMAALMRLLAVQQVGFDKVNQLRHCRMFPDRAALDEHMAGHRAILAPKFDHLLRMFDEQLTGLASWSRPAGGYFISLDLQPGCAAEVVELAAGAGLRLTAAGATFPGGADPADSNIRIAPSYPPLDEVERAAQVLCCCVRLAAARRAGG